MYRIHSSSFFRPYLHVEKYISQYVPYTSVKYRGRNFTRSSCAYDGEIKNGENEATICELSDSSENSQNRLRELIRRDGLHWPRIENHSKIYTIQKFREKWECLTAGKDADINESICVRGKLMACRIMGTRLIFMDLRQDGKTLQVMANLGSLQRLSQVSEESFERLYHLAQRGDYISVSGYAHRTKRGELSIFANSLPTIISPSIRSLPKTLLDRAMRMRNRHLDLNINRSLQQTIRMRSHLIQYLREYLLKDSFIEVQTPVLAHKASGAVARPFLTSSDFISGKTIALRVAPELWLKRLIIGGFDRVFEIGAAFRNEGFDHTHNPEFTTCEFYKAFTGIEDLMEMTEIIFSGMAKVAQKLQKSTLVDLPEVDIGFFKTPFRRIDFIPAIEEALKDQLPKLAAENAEEEVIALFLKHNITLPEVTTLPRLLDKLSAIYIEPWCTIPTLVMHHPACMAPLAKSFLNPKYNQVVSARAELFVNCREIANMYEEENSPIEQRRKFEEQGRFKDVENEGYVDESYLSALELGLPPTGGWGCGIDRLIMLFTGAKRIQDVLSFGGLKNVISIGSTATTKTTIVDNDENNKEGDLKLDDA